MTFTSFLTMYVTGMKPWYFVHEEEVITKYISSTSTEKFTNCQNTTGSTRKFLGTVKQKIDQSCDTPTTQWFTFSFLKLIFSIKRQRNLEVQKDKVSRRQDKKLLFQRYRFETMKVNFSQRSPSFRYELIAQGLSLVLFLHFNSEARVTAVNDD